MFHIIVGVPLILAGVVLFFFLVFAAGMSDSPDASAEAMRQTWWCLVPIVLGLLSLFWRWG